MIKHRFLITGASGFVGANLARTLVKKNQEVHLILRPQAKLWRINDIINYTTLHLHDLKNVKTLTTICQEVQPTVIYHLAAYGAYPHQQHRPLIMQTNLMGTLNLLTAVKDIPYQLLVNTGSSSEYGFSTKPMNENDLPDPNSDYAVSKLASSMLCRYTALSQKKPIITARLFSVYGPYEESSRLVPTILYSLLQDKSMKLVSPKIARDFIYIDDVVNFYLQINKLKKYGGHIFNVGTGKQSTIKQLVNTAQQVTNRQLTTQWEKLPQRAWDTNHWVADMKKVHQQLKWQAKSNLDSGLTKTWAWFKQHPDLYG